jgi:hypothetical protein
MGLLTDQKKEDVLDNLRKWIKLQKDTPYGSITAEIFWEQRTPIKVEIKQGGKRTILTSEINFD